MNARPASRAAVVTLAVVGLAHLVPRRERERDGERSHVVDIQARTVINRFSYIPPQCYTKTRDADGTPHNPCFVCHRRSEPPNFVDDGALQLRWALPAEAVTNPWTNLFAPPLLAEEARGDPPSDEEVLTYVRRSNYRDPVVGATWRGYRPDAAFSFDERGFDRDPAGGYTGWRAFAYYPFPGTFFPANGAADDVLIRLDPVLREDERGELDRATYEVNLAIVEALAKRADVPIDPFDEAAAGVDVDLDGRLGTATRVAFDGAATGTRMQYVGRAQAERRSGRFPLAAGLLPPNTELLHSVRYLDVDAGGNVVMAARMKELRYAKKIRFVAPRDLEIHAAREAVEQARSVGGALHYGWEVDEGVYNGQGWLFQGFIEDADGALRPQSYEETLACVGCHGGIGATTDSVFSMARKLGADAPARGWFHWSARGLRGLPEPRAGDGSYEYTRYLEANGAADELRENEEARERFFDSRGALRPEALERLHRDIAELLLPSAGRAIALDRAYQAIVREQSFIRGRDPVLDRSDNVYARAPNGEPTGIDGGIDVGNP